MKKRGWIAITVGFVWGVSTLLPPFFKQVPKPYFSQTKFENIAHGGGHGLSPENVMVTYTRSIQAGADVLEIDVHQSADGHIVMMHDEDVSRTTNGQGLIKEMSLAKLRELDAGYAKQLAGEFAFRNKGISVPTLSELLAGEKVDRLIIEIKQERPSMAVALCKQLRAADLSDKVIVASFFDRAVAEYRAECPESVISTPTYQAARFIIAQRLGVEHLFAWDMDILQLPYEMNNIRIITPSLIADAQRLGFPVHAWTVNETAVMQELIEWGIDGIITDYPARLSKLLVELD